MLRPGEGCCGWLVLVSRIKWDKLNDLSVSRLARCPLGGESLSLSASLSRAGRGPLGGRDFIVLVSRVPRGRLTGRSSPMSWLRPSRSPLEEREWGGVRPRVPRGRLTGRSSPMSWLRLEWCPLEGREWGGVEPRVIFGVLVGRELGGVVSSYGLYWLDGMFLYTRYTMHGRRKII